jgi:AcrR family transcriptional regulator
MVNSESTELGPRGATGSRGAVFEAAALEFGESGYEAARVGRIAERAGVNKAMLYYHFGSKEALYLEVLRDLFRAVSARTAAIAQGPGGAAAKLDAWIETIVEEASARPWMPPIMLREIASGGARLDVDTLAVMNAVYGALGQVIAQGQRDGVFRKVDPLLAHLTILPAVLIFLVRQRMVDSRPAGEGLLEPRRLEQFVEHIQGAARRMLRKDT